MTLNVHQKRVTLNLARHSQAAKAVLGLVPALDKLNELEWDLNRLDQAEIELIYASFDDALEAKIKSEFEADPGYLVDWLPHGSYTHCKLCGHDPIRFEFRINSKLDQNVHVLCGSECIITHGLNVKGAETAEAARKVLEQAIRKQLRKLRLEQWHKNTGFEGMLFVKLQKALHAVPPRPEYRQFKDYASYDEASKDWQKRWSRARGLRHDMRILERFYHRVGWLGTEIKWAQWTEAVKFAVQHCNLEMPLPVSFAESMGKLPSEELEDAMPVLPPAPPTHDEPPQPPPDFELAPPPVDPVAPPVAAVVAPPQDPFGQMAHSLVFGDKQ